MRRDVLQASALGGLVLALLGTYWDDAWHTDIGRDTFWSPPHLVLYAGIALGGALAAIAVLPTLRQGLRAAIRGPATRILLAGLLATLASAPIDEVWHQLFGRDAVAWSPPHITGIVGILLLVGGIRLDLDALATPLARRARILADASVLAVLLVLVFEYDSDVPQFAEVWYLPVLTTALALGLVLIERREKETLPGTRAALAYSVLMGVAILFLLAMGRSTPIFPLVAIPALAHDLARRRSLPPAALALVLTLVTYAAYVPYLDLLLGGVYLDAREVVLGLPLAFAGALLVHLAPRARRLKGRTAAPLALLVLVTVMPTAAGHDPGQGEDISPMRFDAQRVDGEWRLEARLLDEDACASYEPDAVVARRAGEERRFEIEPRGACALEANFQLPERGRWFVYVEATHDGRPAEAWMPIVEADPSTRETHTTALYASPDRGSSAAQWIAGAVLYAIDLALVGAYALARRAPGQPG